MTLPEEFLQGPEILIFGGLIVVGLLVVIGALLAGDASSKRFKRRVDQVKIGRKLVDESGPMVSARKRTSESDIAFFDQLIKSALPRREELRARLRRAGLEITLGKYISTSAICGVVLFGLERHPYGFAKADQPLRYEPSNVAVVTDIVVCESLDE